MRLVTQTSSYTESRTFFPALASQLTSCKTWPSLSLVTPNALCTCSHTVCTCTPVLLAGVAAQATIAVGGSRRGAGQRSTGRAGSSDRLRASIRRIDLDSSLLTSHLGPERPGDNSAAEGQASLSVIAAQKNVRAWRNNRGRIMHGQTAHQEWMFLVRVESNAGRSLVGWS